MLELVLTVPSAMVAKTLPSVRLIVYAMLVACSYFNIYTAFQYPLPDPLLDPPELALLTALILLNVWIRTV
jgi:hypothetical protein